MFRFRSLPWWLACALTAPLLTAQNPLLRLQPTARPGQTLQSLLLGQPAQGFATLAGAASAQSQVFGETLWIRFGGPFAQIDAGLLDAIGARSLPLVTPNSSTLLGVPVYLQSIVLDPLAPNGMFLASNGQSAILHGHAHALVFEFRDPVAEGVTGDYDQGVKERLMALPVTMRTHTMAPVEGAPFGQALQDALSPHGARAQHVYRALDLGASGKEELVTAIRWHSFGPVTPDLYPRIVLSLAHSAIVPDYSVDPISALAKYPNSGLGTVFANNVKPGDALAVVYDGPYLISPAAQRPDGYMPFPLQNYFAYNGMDSLLIDCKTVPAPTAAGTNGFKVRIMVLSGPQPNARAHALGTTTAPLDPFTTTSAKGADNAFLELQLDLARTVSVALTRFVRSPGPQLRYSEAMVAGAIPTGTSYSIEYQGAADAQGGGATPFVASPVWLTGAPYLRLRIRLVGHPNVSARPSIDTIVVPVD